MTQDQLDPAPWQTLPNVCFMDPSNPTRTEEAVRTLPESQLAIGSSESSDGAIMLVRSPS
jgi:hypothetical protein